MRPPGRRCVRARSFHHVCKPPVESCVLAQLELLCEALAALALAPALALYLHNGRFCSNWILSVDVSYGPQVCLASTAQRLVLHYPRSYAPCTEEAPILGSRAYTTTRFSKSNLFSVSNIMLRSIGNLV